MKAFTLVEILVVLAIIALGWWWLPGLINSKAASSANRFEQIQEQFIARTRMEALARQQNVAFGVLADQNHEGGQIAVGILDKDGNFQALIQLAVDPVVVFEKNSSSVAGNAGIFTILQDKEGNFWRLWWFDGSSKPIKSGGTIAWKIDGISRQWTIVDEGALIPQ